MGPFHRIPGNVLGCMCNLSAILADILMKVTTACWATLSAPATWMRTRSAKSFHISASIIWYSSTVAYYSSFKHTEISFNCIALGGVCSSFVRIRYNMSQDMQILHMMRMTTACVSQPWDNILPWPKNINSTQFKRKRVFFFFSFWANFACTHAGFFMIHHTTSHCWCMCKTSVIV